MEILDGIIFGCSVIVAIISIITTLIKLAKSKKKEAICRIFGNIAKYVNEAEELFGEGHGTVKLQWVLTKCEVDCVKSNIEIEEKDITDKVEEILATPQKKNMEV